jgi:glycosyltransferase involved in cell wall biosynthesis
MHPSVTVVMPCYNASSFLLASVGSVRDQTHAAWELVIVDDGSTDDSQQVLQELALSDSRIRVLQQSKTGAAATRNRALKEAHGDHIAFLDADDTWHPEFLSSMLSALAAHPEAGIAYCGWQNIGLGKQQDEPFVPPEYEDGDKIEFLLGGCRWPIHGALVRSQIIKDAGCFDETLSSCMDYDLWLRIGTIHRLVRVPRVLAFYHHHGGEQITRDRARMALNHWRVQKKYLHANPSVKRSLGRIRIRQLTCDRLLRSGYACYWDRDLLAARQIFRAVMKQGCGTLKDWKYMLPAWLPEAWHRWLIRQFHRKSHTTKREI